MRERVTLIIVRKRKKHALQVLLMWRYRNNFTYYTTIGGGIDPGESVEEAARREALEETSLAVTLGPKLWERPFSETHREQAFLVTEFSGALHLGDGPEAASQTGKNIYHLIWKPLHKLPGLRLLPGPIDAAMVTAVRAAWQQTVSPSAPPG